jgi:phosphoenolpyruvate---glycerone phosphotransferase subunit DhaL
MDAFSAAEGRPILEALVDAIHANAARLSQLDGATGDGDHGINMDKGFLKTREQLGDGPVGLAAGLSTLGTVLVTQIGGAMGPLYGSFYLDMAGAIESAPTIDADRFDRMLDAGARAIEDLGEAKAGDKTLLDALLPAHAAFREAHRQGATFASALERMAEAGERGAESTREMVARVGRASRLGERSRGFLDAGSVSCAIQLRAMADAMASLLAWGVPGSRA